MRSIVSAVPSRPYSFVLIALLALSVASCRTARTVQKTQTVEQRKDSNASRSLLEAINLKETRVMWTQPVGSDTARLTLPANLLMKLPKGAVYEQKQGRANVKAWLEADDDCDKPPNVVIEASCDSLAQVCYYYERRCDSLRRQCDSLKRMALESKSNDVITEKKQTDALTWFEVFVVFIVTLVGIGAILIKYSQSKDKKQ